MKTLKNILFSICYLCIISGCQALEMSLDMGTHTSTGHRPVCAVLNCAEHLTRTSDGLTEHHGTISSLSIFRATQESSSPGNGNGSKSESETRTLVGTLTLAQPKLTRVSNGVAVQGVLEAERATIKMEIFKEVDCSAQYSCEVRITDGLGNEFVRTNSLHQRPKQQEKNANDDVMASALILQQFALLQQQMSFMDASLDGKLAALEGKFADLPNKFGHLESRLESLQTRLEDKILTLHDKIETRVVDKLRQLETKLPEGCSDEKGVTQTLEAIKENFTELKREIAIDNQNALKLSALAVSNSTSEIVTSVKGYMNEVLTYEQRNQRRFIELSESKDIITNSTEELGHRLQSTLQALSSSFDELKIGVDNSNEETLFAVRNLVFDTNATIQNSLKATVVDAVSPKVCIKGMLPSLIGAYSDYVVIRPRQNSELDVPYLCDPITEGGGWIVIQRRVSGALDFYRNWEEYKNGFGSLAEEFWLGNDNIHTLTNSGQYELRVDLKYNGQSAYAHYNSFSLGSESTDYILSVGAYDGTAGDSMAYHNGKQFSTHDRGGAARHAALYHGAWWYGPGYNCNLNAKWNAEGNTAARWYHFSRNTAVTFSEMKIRKL
ncbi:hypothetical protein EGW08_015703 [Elysia chlorotica]|uniref:Fibrinogen C-terminal domain-containing protein n=1 Tax=Elysia chlorotica TaxID=188477 RepID=A0A3S1BB74_ELYCH|nr:hypothetical protein EGW08_015703 [Elysia chlorotica]